MSYAIVPVAAVAVTVATSAASFNTMESFADVPEKVWVPVKVLSAEVENAAAGVVQDGAAVEPAEVKT